MSLVGLECVGMSERAIMTRMGRNLLWSILRLKYIIWWEVDLLNILINFPSLYFTYWCNYERFWLFLFAELKNTHKMIQFFVLSTDILLERYISSVSNGDINFFANKQQ